LGRTQAPRASTQAETATHNGNGSVTTVNWGATGVFVFSGNSQFKDKDGSKRIGKTEKIVR
jgi:hypothetical protein